MLTIGITGGIGAGKSVVSKIIEALGYPVFNSDDQSKRLVASDPVIRDGLTQLFGEQIYTSNGLNKPLLAEKIFSDDQARMEVNNLIHPRVRKAFEDFASEKGTKLVFNEAAILFETGAYKRFDRTILVTAPEALRIQRVMSRDGVSKEDVLARVAKQWKDDQKIPLADFVIENDETSPLLTQVESVIAELIKV